MNTGTECQKWYREAKETLINGESSSDCVINVFVSELYEIENMSTMLELSRSHALKEFQKNVDQYMHQLGSVYDAPPESDIRNRYMKYHKLTRKIINDRIRDLKCLYNIADEMGDDFQRSVNGKPQSGSRASQSGIRAAKFSTIQA